jgi:MYXO-CTERM domain-containing protein
LADRCLQSICIDCESTDVKRQCSTSGGPWSALPGVILLLALRRRRRDELTQLR